MGIAQVRAWERATFTGIVHPVCETVWVFDGIAHVCAWDCATFTGIVHPAGACVCSVVGDRDPQRAAALTTFPSEPQRIAALPGKGSSATAAARCGPGRIGGASSAVRPGPQRAALRATPALQPRGH